MKFSKKLLKAIIAAVAVIAVAIVAFTFFSLSVKRRIITTSTLREVVSISELSTGEFCYNGVVSIPEKDNPEKTDYSVKYDSAVKLGIDVEDIDFKIDRKNKTVTPIIPAVKVNDVTIVDGSISTIPENTAAMLKEALSYCKADALKESGKNKKLKEAAESNLQSLITALLTPLLKESGYKIAW